MTENTETPELLQTLTETFGRLNSTIEQIQEDRRNHDRIKQKKINALRLLAAPMILLVIALSVYIFYMASLMEQAMSSMSKDMNSMQTNMNTMTNSMGKITDNVQTLAVNVTSMNKIMVQMSKNMQIFSTDLHKMSDNMIVMSDNMINMSGDVQKMRKATVYMEYSIRTLTQKVNEMSNAVSPVMDGARQFMPWMPYNNRR